MHLLIGLSHPLLCRWLSPDGVGKAGGWIPFGAGARMCLGYPLALAEMKMFLALLVRRYSWQLLQPDEKWSTFPLALPLQGLPIRVLPHTT